MKKLVVKINMSDDDAKRKALKTVAAFPGIDSISVDMKARKMTIIGTVDPTRVVSRLRKYWTAELLTVGPAKEPEIVKPKEEAKKDDQQPAANGDKKPAASDNEAKKEADQDKKPIADDHQAGAKKDEGKKEGDQLAAATAKANGEQMAVTAGGGEVKKVDPALEMVSAYRAYNPHMTRYYHAQSMEENPNACIIC